MESTKIWMNTDLDEYGINRHLDEYGIWMNTESG